MTQQQREPYHIEFGSDRATMRSAVRIDVPVEPTTRIELTVNPERNSGLVNIGGVHIHGRASIMQTLNLAFARVVDELSGHRNAAVEAEEMEANRSRLCSFCEGRHRPGEPHLNIGTDGLREAVYRRMIAVPVIPPMEAKLMIDAAFFFVIAADPAAARTLLHMFVVDTLADELVDAIIQVCLKDGLPWMEALASDQWHKRPAIPPFPAELPPGMDSHGGVNPTAT